MRENHALGEAAEDGLRAGSRNGLCASCSFLFFVLALVCPAAFEHENEGERGGGFCQQALRDIRPLLEKQRRGAASCALWLAF